MSKLRIKLEILADAAKYDASCASSGVKRKGSKTGIGSANGTGICHSYTPDGRCVSLLKILFTNYCIYDCKYCVNRITSDTPRARFDVEEVVQLTMDFYRRNYIEGLFLSSGVIQSADYTMERLVAVAKTLRLRENFRGYIHLKAVPRASEELLRQAGLYADRLSANLELPTEHDLAKLAPEKKMADVDRSMATLRAGIDESRHERRRHRSAPVFSPAGQSTQLIVGATDSPDAAILSAASSYYQRHNLRRVYYSAFSPIPHGDGRLPLTSPPLIREHRLYQADWLMRFYGFANTELTSPAEPNLSLDMDPKLAWALRNRQHFPVDLNKAAPWRLLRVPGLGKKTVDKLVRLRRYAAVRLDDLAKLRVAMKKVRPWVTTADHNPDALRLDRTDLKDRFVVHKQLELFGTATSARTGEV
ncbi:MAG: putative DNA modification/repair radical SAM protein [Phycisphaerae bacterium]